MRRILTFASGVCAATSMGGLFASASRLPRHGARILPAPSATQRGTRWALKAAAGLGVVAAAGSAGAEPAEPSAEQLVEGWEARQGEHAWLEDVLGERALDWVRKHNAETLERLGDPTGTPLFERVHAILTSKDKIPYISKIGELYYNFWTDADNQRGVLRRTSLESYESGEPAWEEVLSVDKLCAAEGESWVYKGSTLLDEGPGVPPTRTLIHLSRGGADATVVREFDLTKLAFVPEAEGGFVLPEAKSNVAWQSRDVLLVGTDFGDGESMTDSGYPRTVREWRRGTPLGSAVEVYRGEKTDVSVSGYRSRHGRCVRAAPRAARVRARACARHRRASRATRPPSRPTPPSGARAFLRSLAARARPHHTTSA